MWLYLLIILGIYAPYFLVINGIRRLWYNIDIEDPETWKDNCLNVSIVIPFRNEEENLHELINSLEFQISDYSEVIFVDDNSSDGSAEIIENRIHKLVKFSLFGNENVGKKSALELGISNAKYEWIITLDADVRLGSSWLKELEARIDETDDMVILPVALSNDKTLIQKFDVFDFLVLQGFTFAYARNRKPFLANGAHLAFKKSAWNSVGGYASHENLASGDDVFLLQSFREHGKSISWEWSRKLIVESSCSKTIKEFIFQRVRWGSKTSKIRFPESRWLSVLILIANLGLILMALFGNWHFLLLGLIIKSIADVNFILPVLISYQRKDLIKFLPLFIFLYPIYITFVSAATLFLKPSWKGRKVK